MLVLLLALAEPARASVLARIEHAVATGAAGRQPFAFDLYRGIGFDISLLPTDERIVDWWVEDPSRVVARPDPSGRVLSLRLVDLPALLPSNRTWTTLKLLVEDTGGRHFLMVFIVRFGTSTTVRPEHLRHHGVEVLPPISPALTLPTPLH